MGSRLDVDPSRCGIRKAHNVVLHAWLEGRHLGAFQDERNINVSNLVAVPVHDLVGVLHKLGTVAPLPSWIRVLKDLANISYHRYK